MQLLKSWSAKKNKTGYLCKNFRRYEKVGPGYTFLYTPYTIDS